MKQFKHLTPTALTLIVFAMFYFDSALADKPTWKNVKKHEKHKVSERHQERDRRHDDYRYGHTFGDYRDPRYFNNGRYFADRHRIIVHDYYVGDYRRGNCPPGLAKKHTGCVPPGLTRRWVVGRPLPRDVVYYDLPPTLAMSIGLPPPGYRFIRVASDILMIAIGTGIVMDAINDLGMR